LRQRFAKTGKYLNDWEIFGRGERGAARRNMIAGTFAEGRYFSQARRELASAPQRARLGARED
jgi:hypothetical protein